MRQGVRHDISGSANHFTGRPLLETLEERRLFAAWSMGPVLPNGSPSSADFQYDVGHTGYHWRAEFGDVGESKTFANGSRFHAVYDQSLPSHDDGAGPDRQAYYDALLARLGAEWDSQSQQAGSVEFAVVDYGDGTFAVVVAPVDTADPAQPPAAADPSTATPADPAAPPTEEPQDLADKGVSAMPAPRVPVAVPRSLLDVPPIGQATKQQTLLSGLSDDAVDDSEEDAAALSSL
ncbi:MAG: hypothetical protein WBD40_24525 [Tepidisphaeraceae bacterium]